MTKTYSQVHLDGEVAAAELYGVFRSAHDLAEVAIRQIGTLHELLIVVDAPMFSPVVHSRVILLTSVAPETPRLSSRFFSRAEDKSVAGCSLQGE